MKKTVCIFCGILIAVLCCCAAGCVSSENTGSNPEGSNLKITNSDGSVVTLSGIPERIVLLNSNAGEILALLGDSGKIIGISQSIANNAEQRELYAGAQVVGSWNEPDVEYLIALNTDVVIGYATSKPKNAEVLASAGIPVVYLDCSKPGTMVSDIREIGKLSGNPDKAEKIAEYYASVMKKVADAAALSTAPKQTVYAESYTAYYVQGIDSGMGQLISLAGGVNIFNETGTPKVSDEWVVSSSPEIILKLVNSMDTAESLLREIESRPGFDRISAVSGDNVWLIRNDITYGPRSCAAAVALLKILNPDALPDMSPVQVLSEFNTRFGTSFSTENPVYPARNIF